MSTLSRASRPSLHLAAIVLISNLFLFMAAQIAEASPASDRAFGNCVTAAAAYLEIRGQQVGTVTVLTRAADQHRLRITPATADAEPAAIICTASRQTTAIEVIPTRLAVTNTAR